MDNGGRKIATQNKSEQNVAVQLIRLCSCSSPAK